MYILGVGIKAISHPREEIQKNCNLSTQQLMQDLNGIPRDKPMQSFHVGQLGNI
jgi:hypothetical protein